MQKSDDKFELFAAHHYGPAAFSALLFFVCMTILLPGGKYILIFIFISKYNMFCQLYQSWISH